MMTGDKKHEQGTHKHRTDHRDTIGCGEIARRLKAKDRPMIAARSVQFTAGR
jgi:hypothetical protein